MLFNAALFPKIMELGQALFFNFSTSILKLPASVVNILHVDEVGQVWFAISCPPQHISEFDRKFEARLDLYRKGKPFHMQVSGRAHLVIDPEEINELRFTNAGLVSQVKPGFVLIRLLPECIEYYPHCEEIHTHVLSSPQTREPLAFVKTLQYVFKNIVPVFQSH